MLKLNIGYFSQESVLCIDDVVDVAGTASGH